MALLKRQTLVENSGGILYFPQSFVDQHSFPLPLDDDVVMQIVPHEAVVVVPAHSVPEYPIKAHDPGGSVPQTTLRDYFDIDQTDPTNPTDPDDPTTSDP